MERLMRTELARVQTEAQKQSFVRNGFDRYMFIVNGGCCPLCEEKDGKDFAVAKMMPGTNAPPMHPNCRCSTAAYEDSKEYEAWLDYLDKGGSTEEWNLQNAQKTAKALENSKKGSTIKAYNIGVQFFANKSIARQSDRQLNKSISSWTDNISEHEDKINNPAKYDVEWDSKTEVQKAGLLKHWQKEIKHFKENIKEAEAELEKRGSNK
jgi:hypothetical protein